ncbi:hypothetical protein LSAT2_025617, partial [Lamellibrachia satsuma]
MELDVAFIVSCRLWSFVSSGESHFSSTVWTLRKAGHQNILRRTLEQLAEACFGVLMHCFTRNATVNAELEVVQSRPNASVIVRKQSDRATRGRVAGGGQVINVASETGLTPLMLSVRENRLVIAERLADLGANVNEKAVVSTPGPAACTVHACVHARAKVCHIPEMLCAM